MKLEAEKSHANISTTKRIFVSSFIVLNKLKNG